MITTMEELARQDKETKKEAIKIERRLNKEYGFDKNNHNFLDNLIRYYNDGKITKEEANILLDANEWDLTFDEILDENNFDILDEKLKEER